MTTTFQFSKTNNSLRCTDILRDYNSIGDKKTHCNASKAVQAVFDKLIARNPAKYQADITSLNRFSVTFINNPEQCSLIIESEAVEIQLRQLTEETSALFLKAIPATKPQEPAVTARKVIQPPKRIVTEPSTTESTTTAISTASEPIVVEPMRVDTTATTTTVATTTVPKKELTVEEQMGIIASMMQAQFSNTQIDHSAAYFGNYLMDRVFGEAVSCNFDMTTGDFTLNFAEKKDIKLEYFPKNQSIKQMIIFNQLSGATLSIAKQVKGSFKNGKLIFDSGCLTLNWWVTSATLLGISEGKNNKLIIQGIYLGIDSQGPFSAQDFVDIIECNLPK